ncbi:MAG: hypothetical protein AABW62_00485 [Thermoproteota archaeon]
MIAKKILLAALLIVLAPVFAYAESGTIPVDVSGTAYNIDFETDGVTINTVSADLDFISILLEVEVTGAPGVLEITFDREYFDSTFEGTDEPFIILADGDEPTFEETETTSETRTLRIELPTGTEEVEIIGSQLLDGTFGEITIKEEAPIEEPEIVPEETQEEVPVEEEIPEETVPEEEVPVEETTPEAETDKCGPGTILKDGACVLDERCGPGTHFEDGVCVLDQKETTTEGVSLGGSNTSQLIIPAIIGFGIAFIVMIILWLIGRAGRSNPSAASSL